MNRFESQFDATRVLMAVVHPATTGEALAAAHALRDLGVRAVFITPRWLRSQYRGRATRGTLFDWIDYPGFDSGTMVFGAAVMIHAAELHVWSRAVHAHK